MENMDTTSDFQISASFPGSKFCKSRASLKPFIPTSLLKARKIPTKNTQQCEERFCEDSVKKNQNIFVIRNERKKLLFSSKNVYNIFKNSKNSNRFKKFNPFLYKTIWSGVSQFEISSSFDREETTCKTNLPFNVHQIRIKPTTLVHPALILSQNKNIIESGDSFQKENMQNSMIENNIAISSTVKRIHKLMKEIRIELSKGEKMATFLNNNFQNGINNKRCSESNCYHAQNSS